MADKKISELVEATEVDIAAFIPIVEGATNKKMSIETLLAAATGATTFTDLTDAPATIPSGALLAGNAAGDELEFLPAIYSGGFVRLTEDGLGDGVSFVVQGADDPSAASASLFSDSNNNAQIQLTDGINSLQFNTNGTDTEILLTGDQFKMTGFDVVASDATATLTVDAVEYSVSKAIKVKIGSEVYWFPLFGPLVP